jgi:hypothetical protein
MSVLQDLDQSCLYCGRCPAFLRPKMSDELVPDPSTVLSADDDRFVKVQNSVEFYRTIQNQTSPQEHQSRRSIEMDESAAESIPGRRELNQANANNPIPLHVSFLCLGCSKEHTAGVQPFYGFYISYNRLDGPSNLKPKLRILSQSHTQHYHCQAEDFSHTIPHP